MITKKTKLAYVVSILMVVAIGLTAVTANASVISNLGSLGDDESYGHAINASGQVAGYTYTAVGEFHAFITGTSGVGMTDLGFLSSGDQSYGCAYGINNSGQVVGTSRNADGEYRAFITGANGAGMTDLGTLGGDDSRGKGINASGQVTGWSMNAAGQAHAFITGANGVGMTGLGTLGPDQSYDSGGFAINDSGQIAGYSYTAGGEVHAFITGANGVGMTNLGTLGGAESWGYAINNSGQVAGYSRNATGEWRAFIWTSDEGMTDLGSLGGDRTQAFGINDYGHVVGFSRTQVGGLNSTNDHHDHAFLYVDGSMIDLDVWLDTVDPVEGAKWTLKWAYDLSDTGLITGYGVYHDPFYGDVIRAFLLDVSSIFPEGDINQDFRVDFQDYALLAKFWFNDITQQSDIMAHRADLEKDDFIDSQDLLVLTQNWLECTWGCD